MTMTMERPALTTAERCDRCGAQALVVVLLPLPGDPVEKHDNQDGWPLMFCGHHYNRHSNSLPANAMIHADERDRYGGEKL